MSDSKSLVTRIAERFGVDTRKFYDTLKATAVQTARWQRTDR